MAVIRRCLTIRSSQTRARRRGLSLVHNGNERAALTLRTAKELGQLGAGDPHIGCAGSGVPLGIIRMVSMLSSLGDVPRKSPSLRDREYGADAELDCG
jgi:enamidase